jgi:hypothetical protein
MPVPSKTIASVFVRYCEGPKINPVPIADVGIRIMSWILTIGKVEKEADGVSQE